MMKHLDKYFPVYFIAFLIAGVAVVWIQAERRDRQFNERCAQLGGERVSMHDHVCAQPGSVIEVPR